MFEQHCEEGLARFGCRQRLQAMTDSVREAIIEWLAENPDATWDVKTRLNLGYLTYQVLLSPPQVSRCCDNVSYIDVASILLQNLLDVMNDLLQVADPESGSTVAMRGRQASDSALLLSTTKVLDDILDTNTFTFPLGMQKQPPSYKDIPAGPSPQSKKRKKSKERKSQAKEASTEVHSFHVVDVRRVCLD